MDFAKIDLKEHRELAREIVMQSVQKKFKERRDFEKFRNKITKAHKGVIFHNLYFIKAYQDLLKEKKIKENNTFYELIQKRRIRTMSGVTPVTVVMKPFPCPGRCIYCPTDVRMPKSYLPSQPAAQRAFRQRFNPYSQVFVRLRALKMTGHEISKIELRILGGTFSAYSKNYQTWFVKRCIQAMNEFPKKTKETHKTKINKVKSLYGTDVVNTLVVKSLAKKQLTWKKVAKQNEKAKNRCIGINIETRPDHISTNDLKRLRSLGVTKIEMGVQTINDKIQKNTKRGHDLKTVHKATKLLKNAGFKIGYHMMPNLPGSSIQLDKKMIKELFTDPAYQPDYLKIYPCVVLPNTELHKLFKQGKYKSYDTETLTNILKENLKSIPEWCRLDRLARDIPSDKLESGFTMSNIRQIVEQELIKENNPPKEIRFREIRDQKIDPKKVQLITRSYKASNGTEHFLSFEDRKQDKLIALLRLRFPSETNLKELKNCALIREVHVYGKQVAVGKKGTKKQHAGWGTKLMNEAEKLAKQAGYKSIAVISGIGTREYYRKKGYKLVGTYMVKQLKAQN